MAWLNRCCEDLERKEIIAEGAGSKTETDICRRQMRNKHDESDTQASRWRKRQMPRRSTKGSLANDHRRLQRKG